MSPQPPRIWVLLGERRGDNNQLLALAEALGFPFETRTITYGWWWWSMLTLFPRQPFLLTRGARRSLGPPWPDLVIGIGRRNVAVARWIKRQSSGRTKIVRLGDPRADSRLFDLVITTPQYPVPRKGNVLALPFAITRNSKPAKPTADEAHWLASLPRPHLLVCLGGPTRYWKLDEAEVSRAAQEISRKAGERGGSLIVATSQRTPTDIVDVIDRSSAGRSVLADGRIRFPVLVADADEHYVTADSVSMISETLLTGRPVGLIPVELDAEGRRALGTVGQSRSKRDIRRFWSELEAKGLRGTVEMPVSSTIADPLDVAAEAVRRLLADGVD
jgi:mitochondrial fission protein ELM1